MRLKQEEGRGFEKLRRTFRGGFMMFYRGRKIFKPPFNACNV